MNIDFSIIIPHKNCSKLLVRLLKTIPQTKQFQIIVVDDHSTEEEYLEVVKLQEIYSFELYRSKIKYCGNARNTAFPYIKGKWMICADADDFFTPNFLTMVNKYKDSDADLIYFNVESRYSDTMELAYRGGYVQRLIKKYTQDNNEEYLRCRWITPWAKMYKWSFILKHRFEFGHLRAGEDNLWSVQTGFNANKIEVESTPLYCVTVSSGSITTTLNKDVFDSRFLSTLEANKYLRSKGLGKYQSSVLYYLAKAYQFGWGYELHVIKTAIKNGANPFIGLSKLFHLGRTMQTRQNKKIIKDERK